MRILITMLALLACAVKSDTPLQTVPQVDLNRYAGTWYEIARYPNRFQKKCQGSTAEYTLRPDGKVTVLNTCYKAGAEVSTIKGKAWVPDPADPGKLKVQFFWPFRASYWIIDLGSDYEYAIVSGPKRKYLWVLSRTPELEESVYAGIIEKLTTLGFEPEQLIVSRWEK